MSTTLPALVASYFFAGGKKYAPLPSSEGASTGAVSTAHPQQQKKWLKLAVAITLHTVLIVYCTLQAAEHFLWANPQQVQLNSPGDGGPLVPFRNSSINSNSSNIGCSSNNSVVVETKRWKDFRKDIPMWAQKLPKMDPKKEICFVHVGKTAGTTLACYLGFLYDSCQAHGKKSAVYHAPGLLPVATTNLIHTSYDDCASKDFDYYLFIARDPLQRIQSWFTYELPRENGKNAGARFDRKKPLFTECGFQTLNQLGEEGLAPRNLDDPVNPQDLCQKRARFAITGEVGYAIHNYYNFGYYLDQVKASHANDVEIAVIRTEHLEEDWRSVEEDVLQGPTGLNVTFLVQRNRSPKRSEDLYLSDIARLRICQALCKEIQVYKELLYRAVNLDETDYGVSMAELKESCPVEADVTLCAE